MKLLRISILLSLLSIIGLQCSEKKIGEFSLGFEKITNSTNQDLFLEKRLTNITDLPSLIRLAPGKTIKNILRITQAGTETWNITDANNKLLAFLTVIFTRKSQFEPSDYVIVTLIQVPTGQIIEQSDISFRLDKRQRVDVGVILNFKGANLTESEMDINAIER